MVNPVQGYQDNTGMFYKTAQEALEAEQYAALHKITYDVGGYHDTRRLIRNKEEVVKILLRTV